MKTKCLNKLFHQDGKRRLLPHYLGTLMLMFLLIIFPPVGHTKIADEGQILLAHTSHDFDTTLSRVKETLVKNNFQVAYVQRCDGGLKKMGYEVNNYQVVFFGRLNDVRDITTKHAELAPFLPFKLLLYRENDKTVMSIMNPESLVPMVTDPTVVARLEQWKDEFVTVLEQVSEASL